MKTVKIKSLFFFLLLTSYSLFPSSCKTKKNLATPVASKCNLDYKNVKNLTSLLKKNQLDYNTLNGKIKADFTIGNESSEFTIALRMRKDSIIWASISPALGIEIIRLVATKDSIKFIDRLHDKYFTGDYDTLSRILNTEVDLEILQALLVGNSVEFYEEHEKLRAGIDSCYYFLGTIRKRKLRRAIAKGKEFKEPAQSIWLHDNSFKISRILFKDFNAKREFDAHFYGFQKIDFSDSTIKQILMPKNFAFYIKTDKIIKINLEYSKVSTNKPQTFPFNIPANYERGGKKKE